MDKSYVVSLSSSKNYVAEDSLNEWLNLNIGIEEIAMF